MFSGGGVGAVASVRSVLTIPGRVALAVPVTRRLWSMIRVVIANFACIAFVIAGFDVFAAIIVMVALIGCIMNVDDGT